MWLASNAFKERSGQSGLADARFTGKQYNLTLAGLRFGPAAKQEFEFFFASDEFGEAACVQGLEAALD